MKDTNLSRTTTQRAPATSQTNPAGEQTGQMAQAFKRAAADHADIAQHAYELYEQRGRQDGWDLEDWLKAERELGGAMHHA
ncbi:MAG: DUF2934 domain-containing protein [Nitrospiraceae bacterium]|nr:DUF2934 domain-containing protein [Nitrospiraceae bacterium]